MRNWLVPALLVLGAIVLAAGLVASFSPRPTATDFDLSEAMAARDDQLERSRNFYGVNATAKAPAVVSWVGSGEWAAAHVKCLRSLGVDAQLDSNEGFSSSSSDSDALWMCDAKYPIDPREQGLDVDRLRIVYGYFTETLVPCLGSHGIQVGPAPTFEEFHRQWSQGGVWDPWRWLDDNDWNLRENEKLMADCPRWPPSTLITGRPLPVP